jgi:HK97 family phage major capsid protein
MASLRALMERRAALKTELEGLHRATPDGALPEAAQIKWDQATADLTTLEATIARQAAIDDLDRRSASGVPLDPGNGGFDALAKQVTILDVIRAGMGDTSESSGRAREVSAELERRSGRKAQGLLFSMAHGGAPERRVFTTQNPATGPGSNLIETSVWPNLIDRLREKLVVRRMGATVLSELQGNLSIPRFKTSSQAFWVAENSPITMSDPATDAVALTPKHVGALVEISRNMVQQSSPDVVRMVENDMAQVIAVAIDRAALKGGGPNEPKGILDPGSGVPTRGLGGAAPTWNDIITAIASVDVANALDGSLGWVTNSLAVAKMRKTLHTPGDTNSNFLMPEPNSLAGYPLAATQALPADGTVVSGGGILSSLIFGAWENLIIGYWSELDILVNPYAEQAYAKGNVQVRCMATVDVAIKQPLSFSALLGVGTA